MNKKSILIQLLVLFWIIFAVFIYFFNLQSLAQDKCLIKHGCLSLAHHSYKISLNEAHRYYFDAFKGLVGVNENGSHTVSPIIYIVGGLLFLYLANFLYEKYFEKKSKLKLKLSPFLFFLIFTFIFFFVYERWINFFNLETPIKYTSIFLKYPLLISEVLLIVMVTVAVGKKIFDRWFFKFFKLDNNLPLFLLSFAFGLVVMILPLFVLGLFGLLWFKYVLVLLIILLLISHKEVWFWIKCFFRRSILIEANYSDPFIFLLLLTLVFVAHNFLELIRPLPLGFDDLTVYMNNPKTIAEEGHLLSGVMSHYEELFVSLGSIIFKNVNVSLLLAFLGSIFSLITFYYLSFYYFSKRGFEFVKARGAAMFAATLFYTLPMTVFQSSKDLKVDLMSIFFTLIALFCFWVWKEKFVNSKKNISLILYLAAFLSGFAAAIKYTNFLFVLILFIYLVWVIFQKHRFDFRKYILALIFIFFAFLPILPMVTRNIYQTRSLAPADIRFGKGAIDSFKIDPPFAKEVTQPDYKKYMKNNSTGNREELGRYIGYDKWYKKYLLLPFRVTQNKYISGPFVDIGYLFLGLLPLVLLVYFKIKTGKVKTLLLEIAILGFIFWVIWIFTASNIIWYGLSGFIFLVLLLVEVYDGVKNNFKCFLYYFIFVIVLIWLISATVVRTTFLPAYNIVIDPTGLEYARGEINNNDYVNNKFQPYATIIDNINAEIRQNPSNPPKIYRVGTFYKYMITLNDKTVLDDQMLDKFMYVYQDKDASKTLERFKNTGIKYIIMDRNLINIDKTPDQSLVKKGNDFNDFIQKNGGKLELLTSPDDGRLMILKVK